MSVLHQPRLWVNFLHPILSLSNIRHDQSFVKWQNTNLCIGLVTKWLTWRNWILQSDWRALYRLCGTNRCMAVCYQVEKAVWCKRFVNLVCTLTSPIHPSTWLGDLWFKVVLPWQLVMSGNHYLVWKTPLYNHLLSSYSLMQVNHWNCSTCIPELTHRFLHVCLYVALLLATLWVQLLV